MSRTSGTGELRQHDNGVELLLQRQFRADIEDVWASVTESSRTEQWIGSWEGETGEGAVLTFTMTAEDSAEPEEVTILECREPHRLLTRFESEAGTWYLGLDLQQIEDVTTLTFSHVLQQGEDVTQVGPGWEYYLDRLVAVRSESPMPDWDEYYPALIGYYADLE